LRLNGLPIADLLGPWCAAEPTPDQAKELIEQFIRIDEGTFIFVPHGVKDQSGNQIPQAGQWGQVHEQNTVGYSRHHRDVRINWLDAGQEDQVVSPFIPCKELALWFPRFPPDAPEMTAGRAAAKQRREHAAVVRAHSAWVEQNALWASWKSHSHVTIICSAPAYERDGTEVMVALEFLCEHFSQWLKFGYDWYVLPP
jgi:hypothetical protein